MPWSITWSPGARGPGRARPSAANSRGRRPAQLRHRAQLRDQVVDLALVALDLGHRGALVSESAIASSWRVSATKLARLVR